MSSKACRLLLGSAVLLFLLLAVALTNELASPDATETSRDDQSVLSPVGSRDDMGASGNDTSGLGATDGGDDDTGTDLLGTPSPGRDYPHPERDQFYEIPGVGPYARRLPNGLIEVLHADGSTSTTHGPDPAP